ncbi:hypothetical protein QFZ27_004660 [Inquilinus ginsengisoli]|uniref:hypothetical protein n=1 Tax=Inquilinus ginsengisoli TaxID=363840 RepID=UPI003D19482F
MPIGESDFEIVDINQRTGADGLVFGTVVFVEDDKLVGGGDVAHITSVKVRIVATDGATLHQIREDLYRTAVNQLRRVLNRTKGKTAADLTSASEKKMAEVQPGDFAP